MESNFKSRLTGKSLSAMIQLKANILSGLSCAVATLDPERTKRDFEKGTGSRLNLEIRKGAKDVYDASVECDHHWLTDVQLGDYVECEICGMIFPKKDWGKTEFKENDKPINNRQ